MNQFELDGKVIAITGGTGVLGAAMARGYAAAGASVVIFGRDSQKTENRARELGAGIKGFSMDVLDPRSIEQASAYCMDTFGRVDVLVNSAGGNNPKATTTPDQDFFQLDPEAIDQVARLNLGGSIYPSQIFGKLMVKQQQGVILNVSSMAALQPLTRVMGYSAAKAAVSNFTQWLAVHMAQEYTPDIRVNALAPGFFLTEQNRFLLTDRETGEWTERGRSILDHTPQARFGEPEDLIGTAIWLVSDASRFVTGIVVPVDGGFSAFGGV